ncbi:hypothetical protein ABIF07_003619 [Bradyrhizobium elkanii]|nr:hypothetical protein [Bradyrhizobium elkanii]
MIAPMLGTRGSRTSVTFATEQCVGIEVAVLNCNATSFFVKESN